eukprot:gene18188-30809_t
MASGGIGKHTLTPCSNASATPSATSIKVTWGHGKILGREALRAAHGGGTTVVLSNWYRLFIKKTGDRTFTPVADDKDLLEFTCEKLKPVTEYQFYVETYSLPVVPPGTGPKCAILHCRTGEAAPEAPPTNLELKVANLHDVTVAWSPPAASNGVELPESSTEFKAQCLDPGVTYRFQVLAFTEAGDGPHTAIFACSTLESASSRAARWKESQKWSKEKAGGRGGGGGAASASASASAPAPVSEPEPVPGPELEVDWKQLRASGQHKSKRASKDGWMKKPSASVSRMVQVEQIDVGPLGSTFVSENIVGSTKTKVQINTRAFRFRAMQVTDVSFGLRF